MEKSEFETNPSTMMIVPEGSVVYKHTALSVSDFEDEVVDDVSVEELERFQAENLRLENELAEANDAHENLHQQLSKFALEINAHPLVAPELSGAMAAEQEMQLLLVELDNVLEEINEQKKSAEEKEREALDDVDEDEEEVVIEDDLSDEDREKAEDVADSITGSRNRRRACKKLFQKIAARTHPDKTSDIELTKIFIVAKEYNKKCDLEALEMLWDVVKGNRNSMRKRWMAKLANRKKDLDEVHAKIRTLINNDAFKLLQLSHGEGMGRACAIYAQNVKANARQTRMNIMQLKNRLDDAKWRRDNPGKERPKPSRIQSSGGVYFVVDPWSGS